MLPRANQTGFTGVRFHPSGRFYAEIRAAGEHIVLLMFDTAELGMCVRRRRVATWAPDHHLQLPRLSTLAETEFVGQRFHEPGQR